MATEYKVPEAYSQYLDQLQNSLLSKTETVNYNPLSPSALKSAIAKALRPGYDKAIQNRQASAATNRAAIDADAAARGVGASTWVTDVKNRQNDAMAKDIAGIESDYSGQLYQNLLSKLSEQDQMSMTAQQFNANAKQNALAQALAQTDKWWEKWKEQAEAGVGGGGSGSGGSSGGGYEPKPVIYSPTYEEIKENKVQQLLRNAQKYLDTENKAIYNPSKVANATIRGVKKYTK